jgi:hypothetical protein
MTVAEPIQELGRKGVATIKRWLEATTYIELPWDVYNQEMECTVHHLAGVKRLDLAGHFLTGNKEAVMVECKRYSSPGGQFNEYLRLLAIAYSTALWEIAQYGKCRVRNYIWVTYHPFSLSNWPQLETHQTVRQGIEANPDLAGDGEIDDDMVRTIAERVMVLVFNEKQENLSLTRQELIRFRTVLDRKANSL